MLEDIKTMIAQEIEGKPTDQTIEIINELRAFIHEFSPMKNEPCDLIQWVKIERVSPNDYNPNSTAGKEMNLLYISIKEDGVTMPVVTIQDGEGYTIVDGFHRYFTCKTMDDLKERMNGYLPITVINKSLEERIAATVRHNRARGSHSVQGMSNLVFKMLQEGVSDDHICNKLGLDATELVKLKHITGYSKLYENVEYGKAWTTDYQIREKKGYLESLKSDKKTE
jgi:ParB-like chromosome segregation protein Spo0J